MKRFLHIIFLCLILTVCQVSFSQTPVYTFNYDRLGHISDQWESGIGQVVIYANNEIEIRSIDAAGRNISERFSISVINAFESAWVAFYKSSGPKEVRLKLPYGVGRASYGCWLEVGRLKFIYIFSPRHGSVSFFCCIFAFSKIY